MGVFQLRSRSQSPRRYFRRSPRRRPQKRERIGIKAVGTHGGQEDMVVQHRRKSRSPKRYFPTRQTRSPRRQCGARKFRSLNQTSHPEYHRRRPREVYLRLVNEWRLGGGRGKVEIAEKRVCTKERLDQLFKTFLATNWKFVF